MTKTLRTTVKRKTKPKFFIEKIKKREEFQLPQIRNCQETLAGVIDGSVLCNIFITAWQMFSGVAYVNHSTVLYDKLGKKLFPECIEISDLSEIEQSGYQFPFDCEGTKGEEVKIIEKGVFKNLLHNLTTAKILGTTSTGNAGRKALLSGTIHIDTTVIPKNLCMLPGNKSLSELLKELEDGIYIFES